MFAHDAFILIPVVSPVCMRRVSWLHSSQSCLPPGGPWLAHYPDALLCLTLDFPLTFRPQDEDTVAKTRAALTAALNDFNMVCDTMDADIVRARVFALSVWRLTVLASSGRRLTTLFVHGRTANVSRLEKIPFNRPCRCRQLHRDTTHHNGGCSPVSHTSTRRALSTRASAS